MSDDHTQGGGARRGLEALARLVPRRDLLQRTRAYQWLGRLAQRAVDAPVALERLRHAVSPHALHPLPLGGDGAASGPDLRAEVTVFVATVGRSTLPAVAAALARQDCGFTGPELIEHVAPWPRAFGLMVERCQTPFLVQVDEDMLLKPYAVRFLVERMQAAPPEVALICAPLWDSHLRHLIQGVKVWRRAALAAIPKQASAAPSIDLVARLEAAGHRCERLMPVDYLGREVDDDPNREEVLGEHRVEGKRLLYDRFYSVFSTYQRYASMRSSGVDLGRFLERLGLGGRREDPDLWALLGAVAGLANPRAATDHYQRGRDLPGFRLLRPLVLGGPEEVGLVLGDPERPGAGLPELRRLLEGYDSIRTVRLLGTPLASPRLADLVRRARARGLRVVCEHPAAAPAADLQALAGAELLLVGAAAEVAASPLPAAARAAGLRVGARVHVERGDLLEADRRLALRDALAAARAAVDALEVLPPVPAPGEAPERLRARTLLADDAEVRAAWDALAAQLEGVRWGALVDEAGPGACDSPFRGLVVDGEGAVSGCLAGAIPPAEPTIYQATPAALWYEHDLPRLRAALAGEAAPAYPCRGCPHNGGAG